MAILAGIARRDTSRAPMEELEAVDITVESGVAGDFRGRARKRQVTVLSADDWQRACNDIGTELPWTTRRANLLVEGITLPRNPGDTLHIGPVALRIECETDPCNRMDEQHDGLKAALTPDWRGGVCCTVVHGGSVVVGNPVRIQPARAD